MSRQLIFYKTFFFVLINSMQASPIPVHVQQEELSAFYLRVRGHTEDLCRPLKTEDYIPQPIEDVSPPKWHIAHTTWFFEEMILKKFVRDYKVFDPDFGFLFNSYYNTIGSRTARDHRGNLSRPTVEEIFAYRRYVDEHMLLLLSECSGESRSNPGISIAYALEPRREEFQSLVVLGLNHEQQHQELLLTDIKFILGCNRSFPIYREGPIPEERVESGDTNFIEMKAGLYEIGHTGDAFCFDNERARHKQYLGDFSIAARLVTNGAYLRFMIDGGYSDFRYWHSDGWDWVQQNEMCAPLHWHNRSGEWCQFTLGGLQKLNHDAPVTHISFYEAAAFAEWRGMRLPTEFEWEAASENFAWGLRWEWTNSAYLPYPGFKKAAGAVGEYNGKFMINQMVMRGASIATPAGHSRPTYRNFFQPHQRWQFTGIRLAK